MEMGRAAVIIDRSFLLFPKFIAICEFDCETGRSEVLTEGKVWRLIGGFRSIIESGAKRGVGNERDSGIQEILMEFIGAIEIVS